MIFHLEKSIPTRVFNATYPDNPRTFGQALRKARIDAGLQIKELAQELDSDEMTIINWELKGMVPAPWKRTAILRRFPELASLLKRP